MPELREVFEMVTRQTEPDVDAWREQEQRHRRANRNKRIGAFAVAAAIGVAAVAVILGTRGGQNETTPTDEPVPANSAEEVARDFLGAYGSFDAEQAIAYLAEGADISELMSSVGAQGVLGTLDEFRLLISYLEAARYQQILGTCEELSSSASGTNVRCPFHFHLYGSYQMGRGPFTGSSFELTVRDGQIVRASQHYETDELSPQMWEPFAAWVSSTHPEDAAVLYQDGTYSGVRLTEQSVLLWEQRIRDYVREVVETYGPGQVDRSSIGRHTRVVDGVSFSFRVLPTGGWEQFGTISLNKSTVGPQGAEAIIFWTSFPDGGNADPCANLLSPSIGPTASDLAAAVSTAPGTELVEGPSDVTVGGHPAKHVVLTIREDAGCEPGYFYTWQDVWWGALWSTTGVGDTIRVWIVDVDGTLLFIEAETNTEAGPELEQEIQQIVGSIRFE